MKRILLTICLLSLSLAQIPARAQSVQSIEIKSLIDGAEAVLAGSLVGIGNGAKSIGNGLVYMGTHFPVTSMVASTALSIASFSKAIDCDQTPKKKDQVPFYVLAGVTSGVAVLASWVAICEKYGIQF